MVLNYLWLKLKALKMVTSSKKYIADNFHKK